MNFFNKVKTFLKTRKGQKSLASIFLCLFSIFVFPSSLLLNESSLEYNASEFAVAVKKNTRQSEYLSLLVEGDEQDNKLAVPSTEFYSLYGAFRESKVTFAGTVNADKEKIISINEINNTNLSILYSNVFNNVEYKGHFKHEYYPLELMFKGKHDYGVNYSFCYLSESQAALLLENRGLSANETNYSNLIGSSIDVEFDGVSYSFMIGNIYLETNYYFDGLSDVMGDFIVTYQHIPNPFKKQACYFMRDYTFQNLFYIKRINSLYNKNYSVKINHFNLVAEISDQHLLRFRGLEGQQAKNVIGVVVLACLNISFILSLLLCLKNKLFSGFKFPIFFSLCFVTPYILFFIIYKLTGLTLLFSSISTTNFLINCFVYVIALVVYYFVIKPRGVLS